MSRKVIISDPGGQRTLGEEELPLRIGSGAGADIRLPGALSTDSVALVGTLDGRPFVQLSGSGQQFAVNGEPLSGTRWLEDGDRLGVGGAEIIFRFSEQQLLFEVSYQEGEYQTQPPELDEQPAGDGDDISPVRKRIPQIAALATGGDTKRKVRGAVYGLLALLGLVALYLFSAKSVLIKTDPAEAEIEISGGLLHMQVAGRYLLRSGAYRVDIAAEGYFPVEKEIDVGDASNQEFQFNLRKLPGRVVVTSSPVVTGEVWVDGELAGQVPTSELVLEPGSYEVKVMAERYLEFVTLLEVEGRDVLQFLEAELVPGWADFTFTTSPAGATILADGEELGQTPATVQVMAGDRELVVRKEGYKKWVQSMTVVANKAQEFDEIILEEADGILSLTSTPAGAAVSVDGQFVGATPIEVELDPDTRHELRMTKPGYEPLRRTVNMQGARALAMRIELQPRLGVVKIVSNPRDAELYVDGKRRGSASTELSLTAIRHRIEIRKQGFESYLTEITPKPGFPQVIEVTLLTPEQAVLAATPKTIETSQGLMLRLIDPGSLMMGAPRREQGRRANETQRSVSLTRRFYISVTEVTNRDFRAFRPMHTSGAEKYRELSADSRPAVMLSWYDAAGFCNWLSTQENLPSAYAPDRGRMVLVDPPTIGYRLPTEAEWVWVARYNGGAGEQKYPWGARMPPAEGSGNFADYSAEGFASHTLSAYDDGYPITAPVAKFSANRIGLYDLGGNVAEWVNDRYAVTSSAVGVVERDPTGPEEGQYYVIRGSSWRHSSISELRYAYRDFGEQGRLDVGFRIARYTDSVAD